MATSDLYAQRDQLLAWLARTISIGFMASLYNGFDEAQYFAHDSTWIRCLRWKNCLLLINNLMIITFIMAIRFARRQRCVALMHNGVAQPSMWSNDRAVDPRSCGDSAPMTCSLICVILTQLMGFRRLVAGLVRV